MKTSEVLRNPGKILYNRYVMYFILSLAIANILFLAVGGELMMVAMFFVVGFVTSFFSKNMIVIMTIAMAITNIVRFGAGQRLEGLENEDKKKDKKEKEKEKEEDKEGMEEKENEKEKEGIENEDDKKIQLAKSIEKLENYAPLAKNFQEMMEGFKELTK